MDPLGHIGKEYNHHRYGPYVIAVYVGHTGRFHAYRARFLRTGYMSLPTQYSNLRAGNVKDYLHRRHYGVGYLGGCYKLSFDWQKRAHQLWRNILQRCYCPKRQQEAPCYKGCTVDQRWQCFLAFLKDLSEVEGFAEWRDNPTLGISLDKDTIKPGNRTYGPGLVRFISRAENTRVANAQRRK